MVVCSGEVSNTIQGTILTFTDTGTGYGTIVSRTLQIFDSNNVLLDTINMGVALTANYPITADGYFVFILTVIDNTGTYTCTVKYLAENIYIAALLNILAGIGCCGGGIKENVFLADLYAGGAEDSGSIGLGPQAQQQITTANTLINQVY